ncbi:MAG: fatty acid hydroxylase family protein [Bacteroidetes bacterium]|nr:MAG: fatty acid hydroxylase family protein [Bacteroidota bacterium]
MTWLEMITRAYEGYANYLVKELGNPMNNGGSYFYLLILVSLFAWCLEIMVPWRKEQSIFRKDFFLDAFYMFFNFFLFNLIIFVALSSVSEHFFQGLMAKIGLPRKGVFDISFLPLWGQFIIYFLLADFIQWSVHVMLHRNRWLWKVHQVHHSVVEMGFAAHLRYHWMENVVYKTALYLVLSWFLNFKLEYTFLMHAFTILIGHLNHTNVRLDYGPLKYVLNNPKMHIWHHAKKLPAEHPYGMNFGITLSIWDYLFRTNYIPYDGRDIPLGFEEIEKYPKSFWRQLIEPFKKSR